MSTIGPYNILGELGRGAMAVVWRGFDPTLEREVAIKEPTPPQGISPEMMQEFADRFIREAKAAARLNHHGIVTIFNSGIYDGRPAIVMELIEGSTLSSLLEKGALPTRLAHAIIDQLLDAIGYAHSKGVVHRDIKPDNIFVTDDGRVKLTDFGIAHVNVGGALTQAGTVMGTPGYMSPEQVKGEPVDLRTDLFAVGVVAYELLAGRNPFGATDGSHVTTIMYRVVNEPEPPLAELDGSIAPQSAATIGIALSKNREQRFESAEEMRVAWSGDVATLESARMRARQSTVLVAPVPPVVGGAPDTDDWNANGTPREGDTTKSANRSRLVLSCVVAVGVLTLVSALFYSTSGGNAAKPLAQFAGKSTEASRNAEPSSTPKPVATKTVSATTLTLKASASAVRSGRSVNLTGRIIDAKNNAIGRVAVSIEKSSDGKRWTSYTTARSTANGTITANGVRVLKSTRFRARFLGNDAYAKSVSRSAPVRATFARPPQKSTNRKSTNRKSTNTQSSVPPEPNF